MPDLSEQQGDVLLSGSFDAAADAKGLPTCTITSGLMLMTGGFETAVLLSLWGGNRGDDGVAGNPMTYWGNLGVNDASAHYVSRLQNLSTRVPLVSGNINTIREAALADLGWLIEEQIADRVEVEVLVPALNRIDLMISIFAEGLEKNFRFTENWRAMQ